LSEISLDPANTTSDGDCAIKTPSVKNSRKRKLTDEQRQANRARDRERYTNMTPEQREVRRVEQKMLTARRRNIQTKEQIEAKKKERRRVQNMTPEQARAKRDKKRMERDCRRNTLNSDSIAMENPEYIPNVVPLNDKSTTPSDWIIPEASGSLVSDQTQDVRPLDMDPCQITRRRRVPSRERQSRLARKNKHFEATTARKIVALAMENPCMTNKDGYGFETPNHSCNKNNGTY
jgi:hypothetical protein